ncbi:hypothetical protein KW790_00255 [Candidatus Parcubacteria bacterium]|nr:hypothetical protein [Candidatus Parcubacteria bacterium]
MIQYPGLIAYSLVGKRYTVRYRLSKEFTTGYSRDDHGMGGGEYHIFYWSGHITVRDRQTSKCLAACHCGIDQDKSFNRSDEYIRRYVEVDDILPDMEEEYTDYLAEEIIKFFHDDTSDGMPYKELEPISRVALVNRGFVPDVNGQRNLTLPY